MNDRACRARWEPGDSIHGYDDWKCRAPEDDHDPRGDEDPGPDPDEEDDREETAMGGAANPAPGGCAPAADSARAPLALAEAEAGDIDF